MSNIPDNSRPEIDSLRIDLIIDEDVTAPADEKDMRRAVTLAAAHCGFDRGEIGIRITDDASIHEINREHLGHDYPTDVISFAYQADKPMIEGELVVSADTARQRAEELGWAATNELILYVVHGTLHIAGMDDIDADDRAEMRHAEQSIMTRLGVNQIAEFGVDPAGSAIADQRAWRGAS